MNYERWKTHFSHELSVMTAGEITGTVYTPPEVSRLMVFVLLINDFNLNTTLSETLRKVYLRGFLNGESVHAELCHAIFSRLRTQKFLDLSCGSGVLIFSYLEFIDYLLINGNLDVKKELHHVISSNIYACDIDLNAIEAYKKIMDAFAAERKIETLSLNVFVGNSLIAPWPFSVKSFDFIIGNPPYIGEKGNLQWFEVIKDTAFGKRYYEGKMDYFYFFIYRGYELLSSTGSLCYLTSNYFFTADGAKKLRDFIRNAFFLALHVDYQNKSVFPERKLHACVNVFQKKPLNTIQVYNDQYDEIVKLLPEEVHKASGTIHFILSQSVNADLNRMKGIKLGDYYHVNQGIVSGCDRHKTGDENKGVFVLSNDEAESLPNAYLVPFYKNSDVNHYYTHQKTDYKLLYLTQEIIPDAILEHLEPYRAKLEKRREVQNGIRKWFQLTWPRKKDIFSSNKIVAPQRAQSNRFAYHEGDFYASADVYFITQTDHSPYDLKVLTLILNAAPYLLWLNHMGKRKGALLELYATPLKNLPLPILDSTELTELKQRSECIFQANTRLTSDQLKTHIEAVDTLLNNVFSKI